MSEEKIKSAEQRTQTICLLILSTIAIGGALLYLRPVLVPFVLAMFLSIAVTPVLDFLHERFRLPRSLSIGTTIGLAVAALLLVGGLVSGALSEMLEKKSAYVEQVTGLVTAGEEKFQFVQHWIEQVAGIDEKASRKETTSDTLAGDPIETPDTEPAGARNQKSPLNDLRANVPAIVGAAITWTINSVFALLSQGLLVMVFMMFLIAAYKTRSQCDPDTLANQLRARVREYLRVKILVSAMTGMGTFLILYFLEVDLARVFGLMAFFLNFIPNIGSIVAVLLPIPVIALAPSLDEVVLDANGAPIVAGMHLWAKALAIILMGSLQFVVGNVLEPRWLGKSLDLNPIVILLSLVFWGVLWGPIGMLLSVPITAIIKILLERSDLTQPLAVLLSDGDAS
ncbi:MAG: AI-2 transport protein TqsA [Planctomycetota bacterium]|jgi:AI-2 transport protein TqsA